MKTNHKPMDASTFTKEENNKFYNLLNFEDCTDFNNAHKNLISPVTSDIVKNKGEIAWDTSKTEFITGDAPTTVNPSLWRNASLQSISGLFKVVEGVYQVRGLSLSTTVFIEGKEGIIVCDTLKSVESARAAIKLYYKNRPKKPVTAIIISQSHSDHFGGIQGILDYAKNDSIPIIAPHHLAEEAINEYVLLGPIMKRRGQYQFGSKLPANETGVVSQGIGPIGTDGMNSFKEPNYEIKQDLETLNVDGLTFDFLLTPNTEAPAEMHFYLKEYKIIYASENVNQTMHQIYTVRGAKTRDTLKWVKAIDDTIMLCEKNNVDALIMAHASPIWGDKEVLNHLKLQRDLYKYMHDQTVRLANHGLSMEEIAETIKLPKTLNEYWGNRGYYGSLKHNVKGIYNFYLGYYSGNPSDLDPLPPVPTGKKYVEYMGGEKEVIQKAKHDYNKGEYRWVAQVLKNILMSNSENLEAKTLLANTYEQLGYQSESANWRNIYLTGALELREGVNLRKKPYDSSQLSENIPVKKYLDLLSIKLNGPKAEGENIGIYINIIDTKEKFTLLLNNSVLTYKPEKNEEIEISISIDIKRDTLYAIDKPHFNLLDEMKNDNLTINKGNKHQLENFISLLDSFNPLCNIVTPL